ncbi:spermidine synthase [Corynebacterium renale]|uniref:Spermidine synthase n=2 Tax=Corynebacterium renale TaxID=1724 RepID=A0A2A9DRW1_9CORY|nr:spermidine synthase [Corynebacterium renale]SQI25614.1 spermidine synthase [Corynebacterium renale]
MVLRMDRSAHDTYEIDQGIAQLVPDPDMADAWVLTINGVPSSHVAVGQPLYLDFEYMRWMSTIIQHHVDNHLDSAKLRVTHLGGAGCTMARFLAAVYPRSRNTVVELDAALAHLARELFDIPRSPSVKIRVGEARAVTETFVPQSRDVIIRDVFTDAKTPQNLATVEFFRLCATSLSERGLYVSNCGDHSDLRVAKAEIAGMREVFANVAVIADPAMLKGRRYGNIVLVGSNAPLPQDNAPEFARELLGGAVPAQYHTGGWLDRFASGGSPLHDEPPAEASS